jgi:hypothetical protein
MPSRVSAMHLKPTRKLGTDGTTSKIIAHPDHSRAFGIHHSFITEMYQSQKSAL